MSYASLYVFFSAPPCRYVVTSCTGYRPILDAAASFTSSKAPGNGVPDVEDLAGQVKQCLALKDDVCTIGPYDVSKYDPKPALSASGMATDGAMIVLEAKGGAIWYQPQSLDQLWLIMQVYPKAKLIAGNTSIGIYKDADALIDTAADRVFISLQDISELHGHAVTTEGYLGKLRSPLSCCHSSVTYGGRQ